MGVGSGVALPVPPEGCDLAVGHHDAAEGDEGDGDDGVEEGGEDGVGGVGGDHLADACVDEFVEELGDVLAEKHLVPLGRKEKDSPP